MLTTGPNRADLTYLFCRQLAVAGARLLGFLRRRAFAADAECAAFGPHPSAGLAQFTSRVFIELLFGAMVATVFANSHQHEVLWSVVSFDPVDVVGDFVASEQTADGLFQNGAVFQHVAIESEPSSSVRMVRFVDVEIAADFSTSSKVPVLGSVPLDVVPVDEFRWLSLPVAAQSARYFSDGRPFSAAALTQSDRYLTWHTSSNQRTDSITHWSV